MRLFKSQESFIIPTKKNSETLKDRLRIYVDFEHQEKHSTYQMFEEFYGDIIDKKRIELWRIGSMSGFLDKKLSPKVEVYFDNDQMRINVIDNHFWLIFIVWTILSIQSCFLVYEGLTNPISYGLLIIGAVLLVMSGSGLIINRRIYLNTIKRVRKVLKKISI